MATTTRSTTTGRSNVQTAAAVVAATFLAVGVLGFIPGITTNFDTLTFAGHESEAKLLGIFQVSALHNIVHILFGIVGLAMAKTIGGAKTFLVGGGVVYLALFLYGLVVPHDGAANFVPVNTADNLLHLVLGIAMIGLGVTLGKEVATARR